MSEKRFCETERACYYTSLVRDTLANEKLGTDKVVDLLNQLNEENEQLQSTIKHLDEDNTSYMVENLTLKEENETLKKKLESLQKILHIVECVSNE